jgi:hypothetical protein
MSVEAEIETFLAEIDAWPKCRAAGLANPDMREWELDNLRRRLLALYSDGTESAHAIDLWDRARALFRNRRAPMKARCLALRTVFEEWEPGSMTRAAAGAAPPVARFGDDAR